ncbi:hypothetical protein RMAECT_0899 [Rickettsia rhipicephali str. Ect]|uniref:Uncharacterized protein n=2 Tax=spotted fever group TaxID=114277 RepID=A0A0F3PGD9_RICRH|nr:MULTISPECIES: hypothetical protein [spotted fever group]AFB32050.1 hypothetical protein RMB_06645 [Rickettsia massiliae str. AZT80]KJV78976.1 hypothetical protein RMAECT_0899 [Rickettsia rhipicephali str. Ect]
MSLAIPVAFSAALHKDSIFSPQEASGFNTFNNSVLASFRLPEIVLFTEFNLSIFISCGIALSILLFSSVIFSSTSSLLFGIALAAFTTFSSEVWLLGFLFAISIIFQGGSFDISEIVATFLAFS